MAKSYCSSDTECTTKTEEETDSECADAEPLLDLLTLYTAPTLFSVTRTSDYRVTPETTDPMSSAFFSSMLKLKDLADAEWLRPRGLVMVVPQIMALLKECLSTHRWTDVAEALRVLSLERTNTSVTLWKVGFEMMMSDQAGSSGLMLQLVNQLRKLCDIEAKEVTLEYVKYVMCQGRLQDTVQVFEFSDISASRIATVRRGEAESQLKAYQGLCWYVEWLKAKHHRQLLDQQDEDVDYFQSQSTAQLRMAEEDLMKRHAEKAIAAFGALKGCTVIIDMFIMKHVELLEYYHELEEAESVLKSYADKHPNNPNTQKYLYKFYSRHRPDSEDMLVALKAYVQAVPSDALALELCRLSQSKGDPPGAIIAILFNMLDYPVWKEKVKPWQLLLAAITDVYNKKDKASGSVIHRCWGVRSAWWPDYHFTLASVSEGINSTLPDILLGSKAALAVFLMGPGNPFSKRVTELVAATLPMVRAAEDLENSFDVT